MSFRWFMIVMGLGTGLAWLSWIYILQSIDPYEAGILGLLFFYVTIFLAIVGTAFLVEISYRLILQKSTYLTRDVRHSMRHALLLASAVVCSLILASMDYLFWWSICLIIIMVSSVESVLIFFNQHQKR